MSTPDDETPEELKARMRMEAECRAIGAALAEAMPKDVGFVLLMANHGPRGATAYMANIVREDVIKLMREFLAKVH